jgi:hypothetical protein
MIRHIWSVLCQSASFDAQTNNMSLLNVWEQITTFGEPSVDRPGVIQAELVSLWKREQLDSPGSGKMRTFYIDPTGKQSDPISLEINLSQSNFHRTRLSLPSFPLIATGEYIFHIEYQVQSEEQWRPAAEIPLVVLAQESPPQ